MSDFVSPFWSYYVAVITVASIIACAILLWANSTQRKAGKAELHGHVWDEDLQEYNNPLPRWWTGMFYGTIVFAFLYLAVYPGLGSYLGTFGWSATGQYDKEMDQAKTTFEPIFNKYLAQDLKAVAANAEAKQMGERLYLTYCMQCHGSDARGAKGFPNLTDNDWLWGGEPDQIKQTIAEGRNGVMPPHAHLGADAIKDLANYVRSLNGKLAFDATRAQRGKEVFQSAGCVACHGADGKGMLALGAPNLTDEIWLYGSGEAIIVETINKGRNNRMPAFKELLGDAKVHLLAAYVYGLSQGAPKK